MSHVHGRAPKTVLRFLSSKRKSFETIFYFLITVFHTLKFVSMLFLIISIVFSIDIKLST